MLSVVIRENKYLKLYIFRHYKKNGKPKHNHKISYHISALNGTLGGSLHLLLYAGLESIPALVFGTRLQRKFCLNTQIINLFELTLNPL